MRTWRPLFLMVLVILVAANCAPSASTGSSEEVATDVRVARRERIQQGSQLVLLGVTDDDFALYKDGAHVYATGLEPGAPRGLVAEVGDTVPLVLVVGKVALIWTAQDYFGTTTVVSPLVVWTREHGAHLASSASPASFFATLGAAVRPDNREILFITNATADGTVGDLVSATPDLSRQRTLAARIRTDFPGGCRPFVGFAGWTPVAAYCPAGATTATLSRFRDGTRSDLATGLAVPPDWSADPHGSILFTILADARTPIAIREHGVTVLEPTPTVRGFVHRDRSIIANVSVPGGREIHRIRAGTRPEVSVVARLSASGNLVSNRFTNGFRQYTDSPASGDGKLLMYFTQSDPATGFTDCWLTDPTKIPATSIALRSERVCGFSFQLFTANSAHALYYALDPATGNVAMFAARRDGSDNHQLSEGAVEFLHYGLGDSTVAFSDNTVGDPSDLLATTDIRFVDLARPAAPVSVAQSVHLNFFPTRDQRRMIYTSDRDPTDSGLFAVRVR